MNNRMLNKAILCFSFVTCCLQADTDSNNRELLERLGKLALKRQYENGCVCLSDINEHVHHLRRLAAKCSSVVEIGLRTMVSSWGILQGLSENGLSQKSYIGIDLIRPEEDILYLAQGICNATAISFQFIQANDLEIDIESADMLFIDSLHTYAHLTYELETFSPKIRKYIAMHDTSDPFAFDDCHSYKGDRSEYPAFVNKNKRGTWPAVWDFLIRHPEWKLQERHFNNNGFTVLRRED